MEVPLPAISCFIRAKNEERQIARAVKAALQIADEVVVVDSGSSDRTLALAQEAGARIVEQSWLGWGRQKRVGEAACKHDWLLDLDADEIVSPELAAEIAALFETGEPEYPIYEMRMATIPPVGRPWLTFNLVDRRKLYDRRVIRAPDDSTWDQFKVPSGVGVGFLRSPLLHYSFRDLAELATKFNRHSTASAAASQKPRWLIKFRLVFGGPFYFANHYVRRGLWRAGWYGFAVSMVAAHGRWMKDAKMLERTERQATEGAWDRAAPPKSKLA